MPILTITDLTRSRRVLNTGLVWNTVWTAVNGIAVMANYLGPSTGWDGGMYVCERTYMLFDTSVIPAGAIINSATLRIYVILVNGGNFIQAQNGQPARPSDPVVVGDYDKSLYAGNGGVWDTLTLVPAMYNNLILNATGLGWVNPSGLTKLCIRLDTDITGAVPIDMNHYCFWQAPADPNPPKLLIDYSMPSTASGYGGGYVPEEDTEFTNFNQNEILPLQEKLIITRGTNLSGLETKDLIQEIEEKESIIKQMLDSITDISTTELELRKRKLQSLLGELRQQKYMLMYVLMNKRKKPNNNSKSGWNKLGRIDKR
jgi:hypothetical protein